MTKSRMTIVPSCYAGLLFFFTLVACEDPGPSITSPTPVAAKVKRPAPPRQEVGVYSMEITLEDRDGDAVLSDGAGPYLHGDGAIVELQDWEIDDDQMYVKSAPGANARGGQIELPGLQVICQAFQLKVYSSSEFLDVPVDDEILATGLVICRNRGAGHKDTYLIDIGEHVVVSRVAEDTWRVVCSADCVGRLDHFKETIGYYEVPFAFRAVLR